MHTLIKRLLKVVPNKGALRRQLLGKLPNVVKVGNRATVSTMRIHGRQYLKKQFRNTEVGRACFDREMLAQSLFGRRSWKVPIVATGDLWVATPALPDERRLDVLAPKLDESTRLAIAEQCIGILFEIFFEGYAHRDFHAKNLFYLDGNLVLIDFEEIERYADGKRPPFPRSFDTTGEGMEDSPWGTKIMHYGARTQSRTSLHEVLGVPLENVLAQVRRKFTKRLGEVSKTFRSSRSRKKRHRCLEELIYSSFSLPYFDVPKERSQRDSARRLDTFGIDRQSLRGKSLLDLGSHTGAMLFEAQKYEPNFCLGIEYDAEKIDIASRIAAYCGLNNIQFAQGDINQLQPEKLGRQFDVVFCLAIEAHLKRKKELYRFLSEATGELVYFEGNSTTDPDSARRLFLDNGFQDVQIIGFSDDDNRKPRPLLVARK